MLNPATPLGYAELLVRSRIVRVRSRIVEGPRDLGASVIEWVIISALVLGIALAVGVTLKTKLTDKATSIDLTTPAP